MTCISWRQLFYFNCLKYIIPQVCTSSEADKQCEEQYPSWAAVHANVSEQEFLFRLKGYLVISTCLSVCEVVVAESFPQQPVLSEGSQLGTHLSQADQVPAVWQALHDVELQNGRKVNQSHSCGSRLEETGGRQSHEYNGHLHLITYILY